MKIRSLYYITHIDNLPSIFENGILAHERIEAENGQFISMFKGKTDAKNNISKRGKIKPQDSEENLLGYANLLFQPRNPMMYRAIFETGKDKLAVLEIADTVLNEQGIIIADGNATDELTRFYPRIQGLNKLQADELADLKPYCRRIENPMKWFLLFATKRHWRTNSRIEDLESGLKWLEKNFKEKGIQSIAMSALGCALGGLDWIDVAPLMCKYLHDIGIPVEIYLPRKYPIEPQYLTESHLLAS